MKSNIAKSVPCMFFIFYTTYYKKDLRSKWFYRFIITTCTFQIWTVGEKIVDLEKSSIFFCNQRSVTPTTEVCTHHITSTHWRLFYDSICDCRYRARGIHKINYNVLFLVLLSVHFFVLTQECCVIPVLPMLPLQIYPNRSTDPKNPNVDLEF